jgi:hypothetical protein
MQSDKQIQSLLNKFVLNECSKKEVDKVVAYIQVIKESDKLPSVEDVLAILDEMPILDEIDSNRIHDNIIKAVRTDKKALSKRTSHFWKYAAAASILIIVSLTVFLNKETKTQFIQPIITNTIVEPGTDKATLTLGDGSQIALEKGKSFQNQNINSNGKEIIYKSGKGEKAEIEYNYLTIPRGGQFYIKLSDGTQVWLNSESQLKFPVNFIEGKTRQVELVYGEAYFDVSPSTAHKGSKFRVLNKYQDIEVIGTEFNIKAYKNEANIYTTLVEGVVSVNTLETNQILQPSQQANLNLNSSTMGVSTVNIYNEISWKDGVFSFRRKSLEEIMKVLSRWYDIDVQFVNPKLKSAGFNGVLGKEQNIVDILESIKNFEVIQDYEIVDKTVVLK